MSAPLDQLSSESPTPPRRSRKWPWIVAAAVVVVAGGIGGGFAIAGTSGAAPHAVAAFSVSGTLTITDPQAGLSYDAGGITAPSADSCHGSGPYSDLTPGTAVTVANPRGQIVATGSITPGSRTIYDDGQDSYQYIATSCSMTFYVPNVPGGLASYALTISHRGTQVLTPAAAHQDVVLTLGGN
ncbi:MAG: hypothetical protein ACRDRN_16835 [Sciscionella sp.]